MAEKWTNTSAPPPSGEMKPKPFSLLNHFTVPCVILVFPFVRRGRAPCATPAIALPHVEPGRTNARRKDPARHARGGRLPTTRHHGSSRRPDPAILSMVKSGRPGKRRALIKFVER